MEGKKIRLAVIGTVVAVLLVLAVLALMLKEKLTPSDEFLPLTDYYMVKDSEVLIILQDKIYEKKGLLSAGMTYIDYETVTGLFNHRFYWDAKESLLSYTTPDTILQLIPGNAEYSITDKNGKSSVTTEHPYVQTFEGELYLALDFVEQYSDMTYTFYESPDRVVIQYIWGDHLYTEVTKSTQLRAEASIKSPILVELEPGDSLKYVDMEEAPAKGFVKVMTEDGVKGYVRMKYVASSYYTTLESSFKAPDYTSIARQDKINMVFHQVTNLSAADYLEGLIAATKGVNVISPTWFSVSDENGTVQSLATVEYVEKAKTLGLEVWAAVDDFNANSKVDMYELLSHTSRREVLIKTLVDAAQEYQLEGINIDFERIGTDTGEHYIQFLRELSVHCRNKGIVLSVDSFPPAPYSKHYHREEQGEILDYIVVMAYNEFYAGQGEAGPVASIGFVKDAVYNILELVPKEKAIIAIPFYARLWKEAEDGTLSGEYLAMTPAIDTIEANGATPEWDDTYGSYYAEYKKEGATYRIWQEEDRSIEEKMKVISEAEVAGVAAWKLGLEKESVWEIITSYLN